VSTFCCCLIAISTPKIFTVQLAHAVDDDVENALKSVVWCIKQQIFNQKSVESMTECWIIICFYEYISTKAKCNPILHWLHKVDQWDFNQASVATVVGRSGGGLVRSTLCLTARFIGMIYMFWIENV
jgi:hypothetical protein